MNKFLLFFSIHIFYFNYLFSNPTIDFIYANANTGQSSGGHFAIKFNSIVYHFQVYPDKIFYLVRDDWDNFQHVYGIFENRKLIIHSIDSKIEIFEKIKDGFNQYFMIQQNHILNYSSIFSEKIFLESYFQKSNYPIIGAGYFEENTQSISKKQSIKYIKNSITTVELNTIKNKILIELKNLNLNPKSLDYSNILTNQFQFIYNPEIQRFIELIYELKVLEIIENDYDLKNNTYFYMRSFSNINTKYILNENEKNKLSQFKTEIINNTIHLILKNKYNWGRTGIINLARILSLEKSIEENKFILLDCYLDEKSSVTNKEEVNRDIQIKIQNDSYTLFEKKNNFIFSQNRIDEFDYHALEDLGNRNEELIQGTFEYQSIRNTYSKLIPSKSGDFKFNSFQNSFQMNSEILDNLKNNEESYLKSLQKLYNYDLILNNCVTQVFKLINTILNNNKDEIIQSFGGQIKESDFPIFIPFIASYTIEKKYRLQNSKEISSVRAKYKNFLNKKDFFLKNLFLESNTLTSKIYFSNTEDSWFLFFTEDFIPTRPIFGIFNIIAGITEATYGLFTLPFDKGEHIVKGLQGSFFSFPELIFLNIRKGTFIYIDGEILNELEKEDNLTTDKDDKHRYK